MNFFNIIMIIKIKIIKWGKMRNCLLVICSLAGLFVIASYSYADVRSYVWTYEYMTMAKGRAEFEYYLATEVADTAKSNVNTWKHWLELEYGITDHWDVAVYQMWKQKNTATTSTSEYDGFKIRTRYRVGEKGRFFVDPLLYLEYIRNDDLSKPNVGEAKLILAKDIGSLNISYNQVIKRNLEKEGKTDHEYAAGISYRFLPAFKMGIESKGNYAKEECSVGPTFSFVANKFWVSFGAVFGLNERSNDLLARMIVGIPF